MRRLLLNELSVHVRTLISLVLWVECVKICKLLIYRVCIKLSFVVFNVEEKNITEKMTCVLGAMSLDKRVQVSEISTTVTNA
jgi:hypothetical protein